MKFKIFVAPILIIVFILASIWKILPLATGLVSKMMTLNEEQKKTNELEEKMKKSDVLKQELLANVERQDILVKFLPMEKQEEEIINNLNSISNSAGMVVVDIVAASQKVSTFPIKGGVVAKSVDAKKDLLGQISNNQPAEKESLGDVFSNLEVKFSAIGSYENVKNAMEKIRGMQRANKVVSLKVAKTNLEKEKSQVDSLRLDMVLNFSYLRKIAVTDANSKILESGKFDLLSIIDQIKNNNKTVFSEINMGQAGRDNPFLP